MSYLCPLLACLIFALCLPASPLAWESGDIHRGTDFSDQVMRENLCALTFDDGPSNYTEDLLDMLNEYGIPATFFVLGKNVNLRPDLVRRMVAEGHEVGNHSWSHPQLRHLSEAQQMEEMGRTSAALHKLGAEPRFVRPPYGAFNDTTVSVARRLGMSIVLWSLDSNDWRRLPVDYARLSDTRGKIYPAGKLRGVFLFHDSLKRTVQDLPRIVRDLRLGGCERFVTLSDYLNGMLEDEPPLLMTRRPISPHEEIPPVQAEPEMPPESYPEAMQPSSGLAAGSTPVPLARSSRPWEPGMPDVVEEESSDNAITPAPPRMAARRPDTVLRLPEALPTAPLALAGRGRVENMGALPVLPASVTPAAAPAGTASPAVTPVSGPAGAGSQPAGVKKAPRYRIIQPYPVPGYGGAGSAKAGKGGSVAPHGQALRPDAAATPLHP